MASAARKTYLPNKKSRGGAHLGVEVSLSQHGQGPRCPFTSSPSPQGSFLQDATGCWGLRATRAEADSPLMLLFFIHEGHVSQKTLMRLLPHLPDQNYTTLLDWSLAKEVGWHGGLRSVITHSRGWGGGLFRECDGGGLRRSRDRLQCLFNISWLCLSV